MSSLSVFNFDSYQEFIRTTVRQMPGGGRGELLKLARSLEIHTSTLSQVLKRHKNLTLEQASAATEYFGLADLESRYFLLLVLIERASTSGLRKNLQTQLEELKLRSKKLEELLPQDRPLTEEEKAVFYSNWYYAAIWAQTDIPGFQMREDLVQHFNLSRKLVHDVLKFLLRTGLCAERNGLLSPAHRYTHLDQDSPFIGRHHGNWRVQAMTKHANLGADELSYSSPMTLSKEDAERIRLALIAMIGEANRIRDLSPSEELRCLNVDWFRV